MYGIMIQGTASDVGKSFICTALCRALANRGIRVAPFKSQNMSSNVHVTKSGKEIGRSQWIQAEAAKVEADVMMNPILLKPRSERSSEVVRFGKTYETLSGRAYREQFYTLGIKTIEQALATLEKEYEAIVIEGAGSPVEMNLNDRELVNMKVAELADVPVILVADIDRGGVFASIAGTLQLLTEAERSRVIGVIINKFRGDRSLFESGKQWIESNLRVPVLAVFGYIENHLIAQEDSVSRHTHYNMNKNGLSIAVVDFPYMSNDTNLEPFRYEEDVSIRFVQMDETLGNPDALIVPGSDRVIDNVVDMFDTEFAQQIQQYAKQGGTILGISSGYHMLGQSIYDEKNGKKAHGLGLIPMETICTYTSNPSAQVGTFLPEPLQSMTFQAFMSYVAKMTFLHDHIPLTTNGNNEDGIFLEEGRIIGTSMHHLLYEDRFRQWWLNELRVQKGLPTRPLANSTKKKEEAYDMLAQTFEQQVNVDLLLAKMQAWRQNRG